MNVLGIARSVSYVLFQFRWFLVISSVSSVVSAGNGHCAFRSIISWTLHLDQQYKTGIIDHGRDEEKKRKVETGRGDCGVRSRKRDVREAPRLHARIPHADRVASGLRSAFFFLAVCIEDVEDQGGVLFVTLNLSI